MNVVWGNSRSLVLEKHIQCHSRGKVNIFVDDSIEHFKENVHMSNSEWSARQGSLNPLTQKHC